MNLYLIRHLRERHGNKLLILAIMLCCFLVRRGVFPQLVNRYKLFYVSAYWVTEIDGWAAIGKNLANGEGFRNNKGEITAVRGPVYPFYLAFIFKLFGDKKGVPIAVTMQMVLDSLNCWLIWRLALRLFGCRYTAALAASMWAIYPPGMIHNLCLFSEPLFTLILILFNLSMLSLMENLSWPRFFLSGALLGLAVLCRPIPVYFPLFLLPLLIWLFREQFGKVWRYSLVFLFGFSLILSPWVVHNYRHFKRFIPASTFLGFNWYYSLVRIEKPNYLKLDEFYDWEEILQLSRQRFSALGINLEEKNEAEQDQIFRQEAWKLIKKYPYRYLAIFLNRLSTIWLNLDARGYSRLRNLVIFAIQAPLIILCLLAFTFFRGRWSFICLPIVLLILYNSIGYSLVHGLWRFNLPMMPYVFIFSAYAMVQIKSRLWATT
jgi:hypothetical protein